MRLLLDCQQKGYRIHMAEGGGGFPVTGYDGSGSMSNRRKAECAAIIATENRIVIRRNAREKAEEKRKDEVYDKKTKGETR
jgi:hypothetical protein